MSENGWYVVEGKPVHIYGHHIGPEALEEVRALIAAFEREAAARRAKNSDEKKDGIIEEAPQDDAAHESDSEGA